MSSAGNESGTEALTIRGLRATYVERGRELLVLDGIDLRVGQGEFVAIIGPSGTGKSTLLDAVAGLFEPQSGEIALDGVVLPARERLGRSSYMKQRDLLLPWRDVVANAAVSLEAAGVGRREARATARARLPEFGLAEFAHAYPAQLSGGMRQRVAFLRTILAGHPLLLLDEPFGALDALTRAAMQDWLMAMIAAGGQSVLLVTHDVDEALLLADRVIVLSPRPAHVELVVAVDRSRPRGHVFVASPEFAAMRRKLLDALGLLA